MRRNRGAYLRSLTSRVPWLERNLAETAQCSPARRPSRAGAQLAISLLGSGMQRKPSAGEVTRSPPSWRLGRWKSNSAESSRSSVSDSRRPPVKVGGPCSYGWRDMPNEILIPLQPLVSCFLEPAANRRVAVGAVEGLRKGCSSVCPKGTLPPKPVGVLPSLIFFVPRIRPMKTVSTGQVFSRFSGRLWRGFLGTFFPLLFPPILHLLSPGLEPRKNPGCLSSGPNEAQLWCLIAKVQWETQR